MNKLRDDALFLSPTLSIMPSIYYQVPPIKPYRGW